MGETIQLALVIDKPNGPYPAFTLVSWSWNSSVLNQSSPGDPQNGPIHLNVGSCRCTLASEPAWDVNQGMGQWTQDARLDGPQRFIFEVRGTTVGQTLLFVAGYVGCSDTTAFPASIARCGPYLGAAKGLIVTP